MLTIESNASGVVLLGGRLDASQAATAQTYLDGVNGQVTLDCQTLDYLSSAGLGVLLKTLKRLRASGGGMRLTGVQRHIRDIFVYAGFDKLFEIVPE